MPEPFENYLSDTIKLLIEEAKGSNEKLRELRPAGSGADLEFERGRSFGLFQAVSLLHSQLLSFNIQPAEVGFPVGFDPEQELIN